MSENNSLINLGNISEPAKVLIEKISEAIGGLARPWQMRREAHAAADVKIIEAQADIVVTDLQKRALNRMIEEEGRKQQNIEQITAGSIPLLTDGAKPQEMDTDWIAHFFDRGRLVSDEQMQSVWSKILAGEASAPGSFSKRTVDLVATLNKKEAEQFTTFCQFVWNVTELTPLLFDYKDEFYERFGISFELLSHLDSIGLIKLLIIGNYARQKIPRGYTVTYYNQSVVFEFPDDKDYTINCGQVALTASGIELAGIAGAAPSNEIRDHVIGHWKRLGYPVSLTND